jgi:hypothetical protein
MVRNYQQSLRYGLFPHSSAQTDINAWAFNSIFGTPRPLSLHTHLKISLEETSTINMTLLSVSLLVTLLQFFTLFASVESAGRDDWRRRSVYQLMTDRFARDNDTDLSACDPVKYCGGTYKGLLNHLDWIQDMGFTAVSHSLMKLTKYRFGSVLLPKVWKLLRSMVTISTVYLFF